MPLVFLSPETQFPWGYEVVKASGGYLRVRLVLLLSALTASQEFARVEIILLSEEDEHDKGCGYGHRFTYP